MKPSYMISFVVVAAVCLLSACYEPAQGPIPGPTVLPAPREPIDYDLVKVERELIISPAPCSTQIPPECPPPECDSISFMRYRPNTGNGSIKEVDAVLVLIPGYLGGANEFDYLGRHLVIMAEQAGTGSLEVWAVDRRPNCLEDLTGMNAAEAAGNPQRAVDYYYYHADEGGRTFDGLLTDADVPYLSEFGLELVMEDIYTVITTKIPDPDDRKNTVFIGGHSLGAPLGFIFAGWDFDGSPSSVEDAGFNNCAGLIGLDGDFQYPFLPNHPLYQNIEEAEYDLRLTGIRSGTLPRIGLEYGLTPEMFVLREINAMYAAFAPNDEVPKSWWDIPFSEEVKVMVRLMHSRDFVHFMTNVPSIECFRFTYEALFGLLADDNFQPTKSMQASLGFLHGGPVVEKAFPGPYAAPLGMGDLVDTEGLFIAWDAGPSKRELGTGPLYSWVNFDEVGDSGNPNYMDVDRTLTYTTWAEEVTDIQDYARLSYKGPSNAMEWYYAARFHLDVLVGGAPFSANYGLSFLHKNSADALPNRAFLTDGHPNPDPNLSGYNHNDVVVAAVDRPTRRPNEVFAPLMQWVFDHSGGTVVPLD